MTESTLPQICPSELLSKALSEGDDMKIEILLQIIKQCSANPQAGSLAKGFNLLALCLKTFAPPENFENYFIIWMQQNAPGRGQKWISELHRTQYDGEQRTAMDSSNIPLWLQQFNASSKRSRYSIAIMARWLVGVAAHQK